MKPTADDLEEALRKVFNLNLEVEKDLKKLKSILNVKKLYSEDKAGKHLADAMGCVIKGIDTSVNLITITTAVPLTACDKAKKENENE